MRILYLSQYFPPEIGATQTRAIEMAKGLVRAGHQTTVLCEVPNHPHGIIPEEYRGKLYERSVLNGVDVIRVWVKTSPHKTLYHRLAFYVSYMFMAIWAGIFLTRGKYDVIYCTSPPLFVGGAGLVLSWIKRIPLVFEVRDPWPESAIQLGELQNRHAIRWATRLEEACYHHARAIVAVTKGIQEHLYERSIPKEKISVIPNGANTEIYRPRAPDEALRIQLGLRPEHFVVIYTGLHGLAHGLETVLEAAHLLSDEPDVHFLFVGDGPRKASLQNLALEMSLSQTTFHPAVPEEELPSYLALANVGLDCRRKIGISQGTLPVKMFSYMACGLPVILCIEGEAIEVLKKANAGVAVPPEDSQALAHAIRSLLQDSKVSASTSNQAREYVEQFFSRQVFAQQLASLLERVVADTNGLDLGVFDI
ncbi:glycosyltransferase family 4 protein [Chloroflexi bacterium TSY]|nr:glycosyltransferase family 4 protein [Chloroflexi bacterium TSY]